MENHKSTTLSSIRSIVNFNDQDALDIARAMLVRISERTQAGEALLDLCERLEEIIADDEMEREYEVYAHSAMYQQDLRNEAVARGA